MRIADVVVDGVYEWTPWTGSLRGERATVLKINVPLQRYRFPGVLIAYTERDKAKEKAVPARELRRPWTEAKAEYDRRAKAERVNDAKVNQMLVEVGKLKPILDALDITADVFVDHYRGVSFRIRIDKVEGVAVLVKALRKGAM